MYFYKTENLVNGKYYYGIHRTNNIDDGYLGSGEIISKAIEKYGKELFKKIILEFFDTEEELFACEKRIVDANLIEDPNSYNLALGGIGPVSNDREIFWSSENGLLLKKYLSEINQGYKNRDFVKRWKNKYDEVANEFVSLVCNTNLPDNFIIRHIRNKHKIKFHRLLRYCKSIGLLSEINDSTKSHNYFSENGNMNSFVKTSCTRADGDTKISIYKALNVDYMNHFDYVISIINDETISDSMLYNNRINVNDSRKILNSYCKYYLYLGIINNDKTIMVNSSIRLPESKHTKNSSAKTLFKVNKEFKQNYILIKDNIHEQYTINFDGKTFRISGPSI